MSVQGQMGADARFVIEYDGTNSANVLYEDGHGRTVDVAWQAPDAPLPDFEWLVESAAAFHKIPVAKGDKA
jgi:hypothetical protein